MGPGLVTTSTPVNATPYCALSFRLAGMARDSAVVCTGWDCEFAVGSSKVYCPLVQCKCPKGCSSGACASAWPGLLGQGWRAVPPTSPTTGGRALGTWRAYGQGLNCER